jgi:hypothetical protein
MQLPTIPKIGRLSRKHKITAAGAAAAAAVVLTVTGLQATGGTAVASGDPTGFSVSTGDKVKDLDARAGLASQKALADADAAKHKAADAAAPHKTAAASHKAADQAAARKQAAGRAADKPAANRSTHRVVMAAKPAPKPAAVKHAPKPAPKSAPKPAPVHTAAPVSAKTYTDNLDGWIRQSLDILAAHHIPGSYSGIYRNVMRESSGNPNAINLWDINARNGIPSKGLLQVIDPTFRTYHVAGTSWNIYNPVANITAACNYAAAKYGSMDNVNSAY